MSYDHSEKNILLKIAKQSIEYGLTNHKPLPIDITQHSNALKHIRAVFVTLEINDYLRGCIGTLEAREPLAQAVAYYAFQAAFCDPRFPPVTPREVQKLDISISVLSPAEPMTFTSEKDLIQQLRPNVDGLILIEGSHSGTFLPSVWSQLPNPKTFLDHLKMKAGLSQNYWSDTIQIKRYTTDTMN